MKGYPRAVDPEAGTPRCDTGHRPVRTRARTAAGWPLLAVLALVATLPACITRNVDETIKDSHDVHVFLRSEVRGGKPIERGFGHPKTISAERLAHILALVDVKTGDDTVEERKAAVATPLLEPVAEALSEALARANSNQQIGVMAIERKRRLGIFTRKYLTSFIAFVKGEDLFLDFSRVEWEIPSNREDRLPKPELGSHEMDFKLAGSQHMKRTTPQTLAVEWSDPLFASPLGMQSDRGEVRRRTVLMETPGLRTGESDAPEDLPPGLTPEALRRLADLEEARRSGEITEGEYLDRRESILDEFR